MTDNKDNGRNRMRNDGMTAAANWPSIMASQGLAESPTVFGI